MTQEVEHRAKSFPMSIVLISKNFLCEYSLHFDPHSGGKTPR